MTAADRTAPPDAVPPDAVPVRAAYDAVAADYARLVGTRMSPDSDGPVEAGMLGLFAEQVRDDGGGPVLDAGCGPGRATAWLAGLGLDVRGADLSAQMVDLARAAHPRLRFTVAPLTALDAGDGELAGLVAWYSMIHVPTAGLPEVFAEFARVLRPGGRLLLAFQAGDAVRRVDRPYGHDVVLEVHHRPPDLVAGLAATAGFTEQARTFRQPRRRERSPQATLLLRRQDGAAGTGTG